MPKMGSNLWYKQDRKGNKRPIQHSILAQGDIFITSGGSTLMFKHNTRATQPVFICITKLGVKPRMRLKYNILCVCVRFSFRNIDYNILEGKTETSNENFFLLGNNIKCGYIFTV
jgi:hypothetical protein